MNRVEDWLQYKISDLAEHCLRLAVYALKARTGDSRESLNWAFNDKLDEKYFLEKVRIPFSEVRVEGRLLRKVLGDGPPQNVPDDDSDSLSSVADGSNSDDDNANDRTEFFHHMFSGQQEPRIAWRFSLHHPQAAERGLRKALDGTAPVATFKAEAEKLPAEIERDWPTVANLDFLVSVNPEVLDRIELELDVALSNPVFRSRDGADVEHADVAANVTDSPDVDEDPENAPEVSVQVDEGPGGVNATAASSTDLAEVDRVDPVTLPIDIPDAPFSAEAYRKAINACQGNAEVAYDRLAALCDAWDRAIELRLLLDGSREGIRSFEAILKPEIWHELGDDVRSNVTELLSKIPCAGFVSDWNGIYVLLDSGMPNYEAVLSKASSFLGKRNEKTLQRRFEKSMKSASGGNSEGMVACIGESKVLAIAPHLQAVIAVFLADQLGHVNPWIRHFILGAPEKGQLGRAVFGGSLGQKSQFAESLSALERMASMQGVGLVQGSLGHGQFVPVIDEEAITLNREVNGCPAGSPVLKAN